MDDLRSNIEEDFEVFEVSSKDEEFVLIEGSQRSQAQSEFDLFENMIRSEHAYLIFMKPKMLKRFADETEGLVLDEENYLFKAFFRCSPSVTIDEATLKTLYKELSRMIHPDKTNEDTEEVFCRIHELYEAGNVEVLKIYYGLLSMGISKDRILRVRAIAALVSEIREIKKSLYYIWCSESVIAKDLLKQMFKTQDPQNLSISTDFKREYDDESSLRVDLTDEVDDAEY